MNAARRAAEAERQRALVTAILAPRVEAGAASRLPLQETGARAERGLGAYRANAEALAERALGAAFPTLRAMLGDEDFAHLAADHWRASPPSRGDVGEWGADLPAWLERQRSLDAWPYLADCARLDLALHRNERAADAPFDADSLALLAQTDPSELRLEPMPGSALVDSRWPIAAIHRAHTSGEHAAFSALREAIDAELRRDAAQASRHHAFVVRDGWRARVVELDPERAAWTAALLAGADLATALDRAGERFDFAAWLADAVRGRWLSGVVRTAGVVQVGDGAASQAAHNRARP